MKKLFLSVAICFSALYASAALDTLQGHITVNTTLLSTKQYILKGYVFVDSLKQLTIPAGTVIFGDKATNGTLIISRGAKLNCLGQKLNPIVFTSAQPMGSRAAGDWGGIVLCGSAPSNKGNNFQLEGNYGAWCGGTNAASNSGTIRYVRIEYAGVALFPNQEINGLTLGAVGSGTTIQYVQVSYANDDAFEWFGGTVNTKYLIAFNSLDDDFDTDNGYIGKNQFGIARKNKLIADVSGSNSFESDNDAGGTTALPQTNPIFSNYTLLGPWEFDTTTGVNVLHKNGLQIRRNSQLDLHNSVVSGFYDDIFIDGIPTAGNAAADSLRIRNCAIGEYKHAALIRNYSPFDVNAWYNTPAYANQIWGQTISLGIKNPYLTLPAFFIKNGSTLVAGADFSASANPRLTDPFFIPTTFRGAVGTLSGDIWYQYWAEFEPQTHDYSLGSPTRGSRMADTDVFAEEEVDGMNVVAYPNPASDIATVVFTLGEDSDGTITLVDMNGAKVKEVMTGTFAAGENAITFDIAGVKEGIYIVKVKAGDKFKAVKLTVK